MQVFINQRLNITLFVFYLRFLSLEFFHFLFVSLLFIG